MDETRAIARLPQLDIEIRHRRIAEEGAEYLSLSLKATPSFEAATLWLNPFRMAQLWLAINPLLAWWGQPITGAGRLESPGAATVPEPRSDAG
jgi:hypothetical protein